MGAVGADAEIARAAAFTHTSIQLHTGTADERRTVEFIDIRDPLHSGINNVLAVWADGKITDAGAISEQGVDLDRGAARDRNTVEVARLTIEYALAIGANRNPFYLAARR